MAFSRAVPVISTAIRTGDEFYYLDANGLEWEFIEYLSVRPEERNDYSQ